jgi:hypothetical protein
VLPVNAACLSCSPQHLVNIVVRARRVHMPKLVFRSGSTLDRSPHAAIGLM